MAKAPRSKAQVAAGKNFAAAGRAAQARSRKAAHGRLTAAQHRTDSARARKAAHTRAVNKLIKAGKLKPAPRKKRAAAAPDILRRPGWAWVLGCNDVSPTCAAAAVANHLLMHTGLFMAEDEVLGLHKLAGGDDGGASIQDVLEYLAWGAVNFCGGKFRLRCWTQADSGILVTGLIAGIDFPHGSHAVVTHPEGMISWGRVLPWQGEADEAWAVEWAKLAPGQGCQEAGADRQREDDQSGDRGPRPAR